MDIDVECVVIGAGVVGLAVAAALSSSGKTVMVLERHGKYGQETSSHNSEVLHASLYYPAGSYKARLCLKGNQILRDWGQRGLVPVKMLGKLVVAGLGEESALDALHARAQSNGVTGLTLLTRAELLAKEPHLSSTQAMFSANTGILDSHALMRYYLFTLSEHGGEVIYHTAVTGIEPLGGAYRVQTQSGDGEEFSITCEIVVNSAGLYADRIAAMTGIDIDAADYRLHFCRGDYFSTRPPLWSKVRHLIYPVPGAHAAGLGVHVTLDFQGRMRLGPDTTWLKPGEPLSLKVDEHKKEAFAASVQQYLPCITAEDLEPELAGMRPKLQKPGGPVRDFVIQEESARGLPGFVNLIGIESPGLTASPAIAEEVLHQLNASNARFPLPR